MGHSIQHYDLLLSLKNDLSRSLNANNLNLDSRNPKVNLPKLVNPYCVSPNLQSTLGKRLFDNGIS